jgi:sigma-B regulation protein RsbU (phosphoserine phosphatase)
MADTATPSRSRNDIRAGSRSYFDDEPGYKRMKKFSLLLLLMLGFRGVLCGQKFDLANGRVPVASLDGLWRFHTGDDPAWANPKFDDSKWPLVRSDQTWVEQGYRGYTGLAWYRFAIAVPPGMDHISLYLPQIVSCYEVYADGTLIATFGKMPPNATPYTSWFNFQVYPLPPGKYSGRTVVIALRVWAWQGDTAAGGGGPSTGGALIGDSNAIDERNALGRASLLWDLASNQALALLQSVAGLGALALFLIRRQERGYLWFGLNMLLAAVSFGWLEVTYRSQICNLPLMEFLLSVAESGSILASLAFFHDLLRPPRSWLLRFAVVSLGLRSLLAILWSLFPTIVTLPVLNLLDVLLSLPSSAWILWCVFIAAKSKSLDARLLLAPVVLSTSAGLVEGVSWITYTLGWQHKFGFYAPLTQKPFPIHLVQVTDTLFLVSVFAILILRFTRTRSQEERFAGEVQAAREIQQYLIPALLPQTPGFRIESEYRPAREVGGDFFQVLPGEQDGSLLIVVGDVAGKGMRAGMLATLIVGAIRTAAAFTVDPARIMALLNERLQGRGMVTCLVLRIEQGGDAILVNAGHLPPFLNGSELPMEGALPLGAIAGIEFPVLRFQLAEGDSLMLMSDGIAEAQERDGNLFGFERIERMLQQHTTAAGLATAAQVFGQEDDITVITVARMAEAVNVCDAVLPGNTSGKS